MPNSRSPASPRARHDIGLLVQALVEGGGPHLDVRVLLVEGAHALGRCDHGHEADVAVVDAVAVEQVDRVGRGIAGGEHRVDQDEEAVRVRRQPHVVLDRAVGLGVAVEPDVAERRGRQELRQPFRHAEARPQDGHDRGLAAAQEGRVHRRQRRLDGPRIHRQAARDLVADEQRDLAQQRAEQRGPRRLVAQVAQLVLHQRVVDQMEVGERVLAHGLIGSPEVEVCRS